MGSSVTYLSLKSCHNGTNNKFNGGVYSSQSKADLLIRGLAHQWVTEAPASVGQNIR